MTESPANPPPSSRSSRDESSPPQVAWIAAEGTLARQVRILRPLAVGLVDELVAPRVVCPRQADVRGLPAPPLEILRYRRPAWWEPGGWRRCVERMAAELAKRKVNLLHALEARAAGLAKALARVLDVPFLVSSDSLRDRRRLWPLGGHCAGVLAAGEPVRRALSGHVLGGGPPVRLLRPGTYQTRRATCFREDGLQTSILVGGRLDQSGPLETVLRALAEIQGRKYDCAFFLIGAGRAERRIRRRAEQLDLRESLTIASAPPAGQMPGLFKAADVYIAAAGRQSVDVPALLALSAGVPVLAAGADASDFLIDGQTALLYSPSDPAELTMKLTSLLDDRDAARSLAETALAYLREHHSAARMVREMAGVYLAAVAGEKAGSV